MKEQKINLTTIIITLIIVVAVVITISLFTNRGANTITTQGNYQVSVVPDEAVVYLYIETKDSTSAEIAKNKNAEISDNVLTELIKLGLERKDIQTENYNLREDYDWSYGQQRFKGYVVSNYIKVKIKDFDKIGKIVDVSVDSGALVNYISFELSSEKSNEYKAIALGNATIDARAKADAIALGLGKKIKGVVSVTTSDYNYYPYPVYEYAVEDSATVMKQAATNISPKDLEISANVNVVFKLW
jgi:hypothetical protein